MQTSSVSAVAVARSTLTSGFFFVTALRVRASRGIGAQGCGFPVSKVKECRRVLGPQMKVAGMARGRLESSRVAVRPGHEAIFGGDQFPPGGHAAIGREKREAEREKKAKVAWE